jgi:3-phenylpropionate/cinnamic acid dioxygenase small subunit
MTRQPDPKALQDAIDKIEIGEMQSRYMFALDWHDADTYAALFTEDAVLEWPEGYREGRDDIHASCVRVGEMYRRLAAAAAPTKMAHKRHFVTNRVIAIDGDRARARCYWFDLHNDNMPRWPYVPAYGYYEDELVRTPEGWRFTRRRIINEISGESPAVNPAW